MKWLWIDVKDKDEMATKPADQAIDNFIPVVAISDVIERLKEIQDGEEDKWEQIGILIAQLDAQ